MRRRPSLAVLVSGVAFVVDGMSASQARGADRAQASSVSPAGRAGWLLLSGEVAALVGFFTELHPS